MGDTQTFNQPTVQPQQLSTTLSQPVPFYTPYVEALPKMDLQKFNGDPSKWADWYSRFSFMIGDTHLSGGQKIAYLQRLVIGKTKTAIEGFACNGHLYKDAINELKQRFGNPNVIISILMEKLINYRPNNISFLNNSKFFHFHKHPDKDTARTELRSRSQQHDHLEACNRQTTLQRRIQMESVCFATKN